MGGPGNEGREVNAVSPTLSIVTITRDNREGLARTRRSVLEDHPSASFYEHIIVDGGSRDGTGIDLERYRRDGAQIIYGPDRGVYHAMNKGASLAAGKYLLFLNAGDEVVRGWFGATQLLEGSTDQWIIFGARAGLEASSRRIQNLPHSWFRHCLGLQPHCHQSTIFSRELFDLLGGYSEEYSFIGDYVFILRAGLAARPREVDWVLTAYEGEGLSARQADKIPRLQHLARQEVLQLSPPGSAASEAWAKYLTARRRIARWRSERAQRFAPRRTHRRNR